MLCDDLGRWLGRWEGGSRRKDHVYLYSLFTLLKQQKLTQYCKAETNTHCKTIIPPFKKITEELTTVYLAAMEAGKYGFIFQAATSPT